MYLNLEGRGFETPTVESAMSWREEVLLSVFAHLAAALLIVVVPKLSFVQEAAERRAEQQRERAEAAAEAADLQVLMLPPSESSNQPFVFVQPRVELEPATPPTPDAMLSDRDRTAQSPLRTLDPENRLPVSEGNSPEFVIADEAPEEGLDLEDTEGSEDGTESAQPTEPRLADASTGQGETEDTTLGPSDDPGIAPPADDRDGPAFADSSLTQPGTGPGDPDASDERRIDLTSDVRGGRSSCASRAGPESLGQVTFAQSVRPADPRSKTDGSDLRIRLRGGDLRTGGQT